MATRVSDSSPRQCGFRFLPRPPPFGRPALKQIPPPSGSTISGIPAARPHFRHHPESANAPHLHHQPKTANAPHLHRCPEPPTVPPSPGIPRAHTTSTVTPNRQRTPPLPSPKPAAHTTSAITQTGSTHHPPSPRPAADTTSPITQTGGTAHTTATGKHQRPPPARHGKRPAARPTARSRNGAVTGRASGKQCRSPATARTLGCAADRNRPPRVGGRAARHRPGGDRAGGLRVGAAVASAACGINRSWTSSPCLVWCGRWTRTWPGGSA